MKKSKSMVVSVVFLVAIVALIVILCIDLFPLLSQVVKDKDNESHLVSYMEAYGAKGVPIIIGMQALQVVVAFFPAAAIQILAGLCYGVWLGSVLCIIGYVLGNMLVFVAIRQFKSTLGPYLPTFHAAKKPHKNKLFNAQHIKDMKNPEYAVFLLYMIPGIPNGILPYLFADTKITLTRYFISITAASIPSVFLCALLGESIAKRNYVLAAILVLLALALLIALFIFKKSLMAWVDTFLSRRTKAKKNLGNAES